MQFFQQTPQGLVIRIYVQPRSSRNRVVGLHGDCLKIAIQAPPVDDAANRMCLAFLSECLNLPRSAMELLDGHTRRTKRILLRFHPGAAFPAQIETCKIALLSLLSPSASQASARHPKKTT